MTYGVENCRFFEGILVKVCVPLCGVYIVMETLAVVKQHYSVLACHTTYAFTALATGVFTLRPGDRESE